MRASLTVLFLFTTMTVIEARAQSNGWISGQIMRARLSAAGAETDGGAGAGRALLEIDLPDGWRIYWRSPGEIGAPTKLDWRGSKNLAFVETLWPTPRRHDEHGLKSFAYPGDVAMAVRFIPSDPAAPAHPVVTLSGAVCAEICVPERLHLKLHEGGVAGIAELWSLAAARFPDDAVKLGVDLTGCEHRRDGERETIEWRFAHSDHLARDIAAAAPGGAWIETLERAPAPDGGLRITLRYVVERSPRLGEETQATLVFLAPGQSGAQLRACPE